ncbi:8726_t:CDS:2 [Rhizophagus irregularis]|nr:8726_t:CDS:2 [Rhizophagus irregularis]
MCKDDAPIIAVNRHIVRAHAQTAQYRDKPATSLLSKNNLIHIEIYGLQ